MGTILKERKKERNKERQYGHNNERKKERNKKKTLWAQ